MEFFVYALSQIFIIMNYIFLGMTYHIKDRNKILIFNIMSLISAGLSYVCLSAYSGIAITIVSILRNIFFMIDLKLHGKSKKINLNDKCMLGFIYLLCILAAFFTYQGFYSLMCIFATMVYTYSVWQRDNKVYRYLGVPVSLIWLVYNIYIRSLFGIIFEIFLLAAVITGIVRVNKKEIIINNKK